MGFLNTARKISYISESHSTRNTIASHLYTFAYLEWIRTPKYSGPNTFHYTFLLTHNKFLDAQIC